MMRAGRWRRAWAVSRSINSMTILSEVDRRDKERLVIALLGTRSEEVEDRVDGRGDLRIAGEEAQIGVEARSRRIVVAGAQVGVAADVLRRGRGE